MPCYVGSRPSPDDPQTAWQARVRLSVDGTEEEFWLEGLPIELPGLPPSAGGRKVVEAKHRRVAAILTWDELDLGLRIHLHEFERRLDPGTSQPSYYGSLVDVVDDVHGQPLASQVWIELNAPKDFRDPLSGRSYRFFQSSFQGPMKPGSMEFQRLVGEDDDREQLFLSIFSINYDPGRGLKYAGSLLIVAGIVCMYYMKAYFFKRRARKPAPTSKQTTNQTDN